MIRNAARAGMFWSASVLMVFVLTLTLRVPVSHASVVIPVAIVPCSTCEGVSDLQQAAFTYWEKWNGKTPSAYVGFVQNWGLCLPSGAPSNPGGTDVLVISTAIAISAGFSACTIIEDGKPYLHVEMIDGSTNADAVNNDNVVLARAAAESGRIVLPTNLPLNGANGNSTPELQGEYLNSVLIESGMPEENLWHGIFDYPEILEGKFTNTQTGQQFSIWDGDTVTVTDQNGWTAKFEWNPEADPQWQYVANSTRDQNGNPVNVVGANPPSSGGTAQPVGSLDVSLPASWGALSVFVVPMYSNDNVATGTITVGELQYPLAPQCAAITATDNDCQDTTP
jgi:hypothetical protein